MRASGKEASLAATIEAAVEEKLGRVEAKRLGLSRKPRKTVAQSDTVVVGFDVRLVAASPRRRSRARVLARPPAARLIVVRAGDARSLGASKTGRQRERAPTRPDASGSAREGASFEAPDESR
jgi:hypothetical protein